MAAFCIVLSLAFRYTEHLFSGQVFFFAGERKWSAENHGPQNNALR